MLLIPPHISLSSTSPIPMAASVSSYSSAVLPPSSPPHFKRLFLNSHLSIPFAGRRDKSPSPALLAGAGRWVIDVCKAAETEVSMAEETADNGMNWVPVVPLAALPKGERRVIFQDGETILLLWYKDEVFAIENRSPAEGAYSEGLLNAKLTKEGCIVCPTTDSTFDLRTGEIKDWYPKNPVLRVLTPVLRKLYRYPVKTDEENIYISIAGSASTGSAEIVFSGKANPGVTATDVNVDEVRMIVDEDQEGFGFSEKNELINGKAAIIGFLVLIDFELLTGKGLLKGTGFLDFLYSVSRALSSS